ncbi:hypothetical protein FB45DRAFT_949203 [Roridomyces roridus]|uniref:Uncharacterized protein n=1 Tax=Roridomyces roridus TaxID=1738132 RepID=A0AAD7F9N7_9AGAR|nr:hypothetical protein FB45DRAFT_949203 [Roridomyces roridus]
MPLKANLPSSQPNSPHLLVKKKYPVFHPKIDTPMWAVAELEKIEYMKLPTLAYPFDLFQLGPTFELCLSMSMAFRDWDDIEDALRNRSPKVQADLLSMAAVADAFEKELIEVYNPNARYSRRNILRCLQRFAPVVVDSPGYIISLSRWMPPIRDWIALFINFISRCSSVSPSRRPSLIPSPSLVPVICAPTTIMFHYVDNSVKTLLVRLQELKETYINLKKLVDAGDFEAIDDKLENELGFRKLSQLHKPQVPTRA